jgi:peptide/nickel transport system permease protein
MDFAAQIDAAVDFNNRPTGFHPCESSRSQGFGCPPACVAATLSGQFRIGSLTCPNATAVRFGVIRFLARRFLNYVVLLALASFLAFCLASATFHPLDSYIQRHPTPTKELIDAKAAQLGLDKPIPIRYAKWVSGVAHGDFGTTVTGHPVSRELWHRIGISLRLVVIGSVLGTMIGVVVGAWGAIRQYRLSDRVITVLSLITLSIPSFVLAGLLILAALRINTFTGVRFFLYTGETSPIPPGGAWDQLVDRVQHLVLPTLTLALGAIASFSRYQRNAMLDVLSEDFIRTARAKGLTRRRALFKHGLRTALIPLATLFAYGVSGLVVGAIFVEKIFGWHGMGEWVVLGISTQDTNVITAITLFSALAILLAGLLSDIFYAVLDPRVRVS